MTDRWADAGLMDGQTDGKLMLLPYTFTIKGSHVTNLVKLRPGKDSVMNRWKDARQMDGWTEK